MLFKVISLNAIILSVAAPTDTIASTKQVLNAESFTATVPPATDTRTIPGTLPDLTTVADMVKIIDDAFKDVPLDHDDGHRFIHVFKYSLDMIALSCQLFFILVHVASLHSFPYFVFIIY